MISAMASSPGVGFLQPYAAGIEKDQHVATRRAGGTKQADQLGAVDFTEGATHEATFLSRHHHFIPVYRRAADDHAVIELLRQIEDCQMRAGFALGRSDDFGKTARVDQPGDPVPGARLVPAHGLRLLMAG